MFFSHIESSTRLDFIRSTPEIIKGIRIGNGVTANQMQVLPEHITYAEITGASSRDAIAALASTKIWQVEIRAGVTAEQINALPKNIIRAVISAESPPAAIAALASTKVGRVGIGAGVAAEQIKALPKTITRVAIVAESPSAAIVALAYTKVWRVVIGAGVRVEQIKLIPGNITLAFITADSPVTAIEALAFTKVWQVVITAGVTAEQIKALPKAIRRASIMAESPSAAIEALAFTKVLQVVIGIGATADQIKALPKNIMRAVIVVESPPAAIAAAKEKGMFIDGLQGDRQGVSSTAQSAEARGLKRAGSSVIELQEQPLLKRPRLEERQSENELLKSQRAELKVQLSSIPLATMPSRAVRNPLTAASNTQSFFYARDEVEIVRSPAERNPEVGMLALRQAVAMAINEEPSDDMELSF